MPAAKGAAAEVPPWAEVQVLTPTSVVCCELVCQFRVER